jgi:hypothetical protein
MFKITDQCAILRLSKNNKWYYVSKNYYENQQKKCNSLQSITKKMKKSKEASPRRSKKSKVVSPKEVSPRRSTKSKDASPREASPKEVSPRRSTKSKDASPKEVSPRRSKDASPKEASPKRKRSTRGDRIAFLKRIKKIPVLPIELPELNQSGYVIFRKKIKISSTAVYEVNNSVGCTNLFQGKKTKGYRQQCELSQKQKELHKITEQATKMIQNKLPFAKSIKWVILKSKPGCTIQPAHSDYAPNTLDGIPDAYIPMVCIVAIENGTKLTVWPGVFASRPPPKEPVHPVLLKMNTGDIAVIRGDLVHAGSAYNQKNSRLHGFIDTEAVQHLENKRYQISLHAPKNLQKIIIEED